MDMLRGDMVGIELLLVGESLKVGFNGEGNDGWWAVGQVLLESFRVDARSHLGYRWEFYQSE